MFKDKEIETPNYRIVLQKQGPLFILCIPELGFLIENEDLQDAYKALEEKKKDHFEQMEKYGYKDLISTPKDNFSAATNRSSLKRMFFLAALFSLPFIIIFVLEELRTINKNINIAFSKENLEEFKSKFTLSGLVLHEIQNSPAFAVRWNKLTPGEKHDLLESVHKNVESLRPFVQEFRSLFKETPNKSK